MKRAAEAEATTSSSEQATSQRQAKCGAKNRAGKPCGHPAGYGTDHPGFGRCKHHTGSTTNGRMAARRQRLGLVVPAPIGGFDAIERGLGVLNGIMVALEAELENLDEGVADGAELRATVRLARDAARDLASVGKLAADAGLDERRLRLEEAKLSLLAATLRAVFSDPELALDEAQQETAARVTARHLRELPA